MDRRADCLGEKGFVIAYAPASERIRASRGSPDGAESSRLMPAGGLGLFVLHSRPHLAAENLFLRKQLALYLEGQVKRLGRSHSKWPVLKCRQWRVLTCRPRQYRAQPIEMTCPCAERSSIVSLEFQLDAGFGNALAAADQTFGRHGVIV
jgi:hypothetical protein